MMDPEFSQLSVLVVDDIASDLTLLHGQLRASGINDILEARDGVAALSILSRVTVDVVITDLAMRPIDGIGFTRRLRNDGEIVNPSVPVLMVSGYADRSVTQSALDAGVTQFLVKPFTSKALRGRLSSMLGCNADQVEAPSFAGPDRRRVFDHNFTQRRKSDRETQQN